MPPQVTSRIARRRNFVLFCAAAGVVGPLERNSLADTAATWNGSAANWSTAADWSTNPYYPNNGTPAGAAYAVTINGGTVTLDVDPTIDSLTLGSSATFYTNPATYLSTGTLNNAGQAYFTSGGAFTFTGIATNSGGIYVDDATTASFASSVTNSNFFSTGYYAAGNNLVNVTGTFTNIGTLNLSNGGDIVNVNALSNTGTIDVAGGATLNITGGGQGITNVVAGSVLNLYGNFNVINSGVATSALAHLASVEGQLYLENGKTWTIASAVTNTNTIVVNDATTATFTGNITNSNFFSTGYYAGGNNLVNVDGTFDNLGTLYLFTSGDVVNVNALINQGTVEVAGGATVNITGGGQGITDVVAGSELELYGNFNVINSGVSTSALAHLASVEGQLYLENGKTWTIAPSVTNTNAIVVNDATTATFAGNITNSNFFSTGYYAGGDNLVNVLGTFTNTAAATLNLQGTDDVVNLHALNNLGQINVDPTSTLNITGGGQGLTDVVAGSQLYIGGNFNVINSGVSTSALAHLAGVEGTLYLENGSAFTLASALANSGTLAVNSGTTATFLGNVTNSNFFSSGYYSTGDNTVYVDGTFTNTSAATLNLQATGDIVNLNALNNQGHINIDSGTTLNITGGGQGVTDITASSQVYVGGNFNVINSGVSTSALAHLASVEGILYLENGSATTLASAVTNSGTLAVNSGTTATFLGNVTNSNFFSTGYYSTGDNTVYVDGTFTNTPAATLNLQATGDIVNLNALNNQGHINIDSGTTLNITGGGQGITDAVAGSQLYVAGNFNVINSGISTSALGHLASVEGIVYLESGLTYTLGPSLTNSNTFVVNNGSTASFAGNVTNSGNFYTGYYAGGNNTVYVGGTFTNTGTLTLNSTGDIVSVNALASSGTVGVYENALLAVGPGALAASGGTAAGNSVYVSGTGTGTLMGVLTQSGSGNFAATGTLKIVNNGRVNLNGGTMAVGGLSVTGSGVMNVNATLLVNFPSPAADPVSTILAYLNEGYNAGKWTGTAGIISTAAASGGSSPILSVGYADGNTDPGTLAAANQIAVRYTLAGDANLDGKVDFTDLGIVGQHLNTTGNDWAHGNFTYAANGAVNFTDLGIVGQNLNKALPAGSAETLPVSTLGLSADISNTVAVPEPAAAVLAAAAAAGFLARRRRRV